MMQKIKGYYYTTVRYYHLFITALFALFTRRKIVIHAQASESFLGMCNVEYYTIVKTPFSKKGSVSNRSVLANDTMGQILVGVTIAEERCVEQGLPRTATFIYIEEMSKFPIGLIVKQIRRNYE